MTHAVRTLTPDADSTLHYQSWHPERDVRAVMLVVHGAAEHGGRYEEFARRLNRRGFAVATVDLPGHGQSTGARCCVTDFEVYLEAVRHAHEYAAREFAIHASALPSSQSEPALPPFYLVGHSLGGLIAALYLGQHQARFTGAVFSGAAIDVKPRPRVLQVLLVKAVAKLFPTLGIHGLDATAVSRDPDVVARYVSDPGVFSGKLPAGLLAAMFEAMDRARESLPRLMLPILIMHGEADRLVPHEASRTLMKSAGSTDKTLRLYPGLYHEIFNEPEWTEVVDELTAWAESRLPATD